MSTSHVIIIIIVVVLQTPVTQRRYCIRLSAICTGIEARIIEFDTHDLLRGIRMRFDFGSRSKVTVIRPLCVAVQVTTCRGRGILWRPHYRPHSLLINCAAITVIIIIIIIIISMNSAHHRASFLAQRRLAVCSTNSIMWIKARR